MVTLSALFISASVQFGLPQGLLSSVCFVETRHNVSVVHEQDGGEDSLGICQIKYSTAYWLGFRGAASDLMQPRYNIYYAAKYLAYQIKRYNGNIAQGVVAYNRGNAHNVYQTAYLTRVLQVWSVINLKEESLYASR